MAIGTWHGRGRGSAERRRRVERRVWVNASPRRVWTTLHDDAVGGRLLAELSLGPADAAWPAAGSTRRGEVRLGLLRTGVFVESVEARPDATFALTVHAPEFSIGWSWRLEPLAGGARVIHDGWFETRDRWAGVLVRIGGESIGELADAHLRELKSIAEMKPEAAAGPAA
jgi:Polyketide cyclase / dehydrase and lipid transport